MEHFELTPTEQVLAVFRKHPFYMWLSGAKYILLGVAPFILLSFVSSAGNLFGGWMGVFFWIYLIILWVSFFIEWTDFILDSWILTNERLVDVEQLALFSRRISTLSLDRIQDVTVNASGIIDTFLKIGSVHIQTAGAHKEFVIPGARNPEYIKQLIISAYQEDKDQVFKKIAELR